MSGTQAKKQNTLWRLDHFHCLIAVEGSANGDGLASRVAHTRSGVKDTNAGVWGFADDGIAIGSDAPDDTPSLFVPRDRPLVFLPHPRGKNAGHSCLGFNHTSHHMLLLRRGAELHHTTITPVITCYYYLALTRIFFGLTPYFEPQISLRRPLILNKILKNFNQNL